MIFLLFVLGLLLLASGGDLLVRGATRLAGRLGVPPILIGLSVVALGTSAPEIAVSVDAAAGGSPDLAVGNVVGSNILNVLLILGLGAVLVPLAVSQRLVRQEVPLLVGVSLLVWIMSRDGAISTAESALLLGGFGAYAALLAIGARRARTGSGEPPEGREAGPGRHGPLGTALYLAAGVLLLVLGARWLVESGTSIARSLGISELVIGLTAVALGTSLPELATTLSAAARRQADLVVGNAIGSNIVNLLVVLGAAGLAAPRGGLVVSSAAESFDLPLMIVVAAACLPIFFTGHRISRGEGVFFLGYYGAYVTFLALDVTGHAAVPVVRGILLLFAAPLALVTGGVVAVRSWRRRGGTAGKGG